MAGSEHGPREPLAIVGIGCRLPGDADSPEEFWRLLCDGRDAITSGPCDPARAQAIAHPDAYPHGGFIRNVDGFDWRAFRTSPREARFMDPQQRLVLEVAWEAFEHAGMPFEDLAGSRTAVFVGVMWPDYAKLQARDVGALEGYSVTGSGFAYIANRVSAFFGLTGPSMALDVMCASSMAAVHQACQALWSGEAELALAGGVNLILSADTNVAMAKARILSPDGRCKTFDARADGFVRGEGAGLVVIKPAWRARSDGDRVIALIRGTAINHNGRAEWIMAPSRTAQADAIGLACRRAGVRPNELDYVELHGTGTVRGDPVEALALGDTVGQGRPPGRLCHVGSVKTNVGHLDSAAGIAGVIKAALAIHHGQIPPSLHFRTPNPAIPLAELGLTVQEQLGEWPATGDRPRLAGVTASSFGGANAHVVLQEPPPAPPAREPDRAVVVLPVSADNGAALRELLAAYGALLRDPAGPALGDVGYTASVRRTHRVARAAVAGRSREELLAGLERAARGATRTASRPEAVAPPVFVFSGQGCSWRGMGRALMREEPLFRTAIEECAATVREAAGWSLVDAIEDADPRLAADGEPARVQPALCALQIALARVWQGWGIEPGAVVGHSVGEIAAACIAGVLAPQAAMRVALQRGAVMARMHGGGATAQLALAEQEVVALLAPLHGAVWIAALNGPQAVVVAGDRPLVKRLVDAVRGSGASATLLPVRTAFHGGGIDALGTELAARLDGIEPAGADVPMISTATARRVRGGELGGRYWGHQMTVPVRFRAAVEVLAAAGHTSFLEVGPHPVLRSATRATLRHAGVAGDVVASLSRGGDERADLLCGLASLYEDGHDPDWTCVYRDGGRVVSLPRYPWQRQRLWLDAPPPRPTGHPLLGEPLELAHEPGSYVWQTNLDPRRLAFLQEHRVGDVAVMPAAGYVEIARAATARALGWKGCRLSELRFERALTVSAPEPAVMQTLLCADADADAGAFTVRVYSRTEQGWRRHFSARAAAPGAPAATAGGLPALDGAELAAADCYARFREQGVVYGPAFQAITRLWRSDRRLVAALRIPATVRSGAADYGYHPALLDACMHVMAVAPEAVGGGFMPTQIDELTIHGLPGESLWSEATVTALDASGATADIRVVDAAGVALITISGLVLRRLAGGQDRGRACYRLQWRKLPGDVPARAPASTKRWLILADGHGLGDRIAERLTATGASAAVLRAGDDIASLAAARFDAVIHLWSLDAAEGVPADPRAIDRALELCCSSLLALARRPERLPIWVVTRGAQAVAGGEITTPLAATAWGLARTLSQELPALWGGLVDLDPATPAHACVDRLLACIQLAAGEDQLALRGDSVLAARLVRHRVARAAAPGLATPGSFVVTGGLGGLGGLTARWLARRGAAHLVLIGRTRLPPRSDWDAAASDARWAAQITAVRELERLGASVHLVSVDVARPDELAAAFAGLRRSGIPPIRGVVHAAGVSRFDALEDMSDATLREVLRPKLDGAVALHRVLESEPLDFFVLFSSIASFMSSPRMGHYAAANAFLDAFAAYRRANGDVAQALGWGVWADVGMAAQTAHGPAALRGHRGLSPERGLTLLADALADGTPHLALLDIDWHQWRRYYPRAAAVSVLADLVEGASAGSGEAPPPARAGAGTGDDVVRRVAAAVADVLGVPAVDPHDLLEELGFDSLMAVELRVRLEEDLGIRIPMLRLLELATPAALGEEIHTMIGAAPTAAVPAALRARAT
jgi:myxalamid-type polyketide synthase MxaE and MxaD